MGSNRDEPSCRRRARGVGHLLRRASRGHEPEGRAREQLTATDLPITEIAASVGYATPQAFARMFRAEVGESPSRYRRERRS